MEEIKKNTYFNDIVIEPVEQVIWKKIQSNWDAIAKPIDGLGDFEKVIAKIGAIQKTEYPDISKRALIIMCADNGIVEEGVSQTDQSVTKSVMELMTKQKSSVGIMASGMDVDSFVVDIGVNCDKIPGTIDRKIARGTQNFLKEQAMTEEQCLKAIESGIEAATECAKQGYNMLITGEMGIGNTTTSTALMCALTGCEPAKVTGAGAGLSAEGIRIKTAVIEQGLIKHKLNLVNITKENTLHALQCVGGFDIAGLVGVFIGGAQNHVPVVIDGFISAVAALAAELICPGVKEYMIASHSGRESGTGILLNELGLKPVIYADMALGEGTGAIMILPLLEMAYRLYAAGTGFDATNIDSYERFNP